MMNERTKPMSASASIRANPRNIVVRVSPAVSGWRAMASIAAENTNPTPTPGPIAASPYTSPWASAVSPSSVTPSWARIMTPSMRFSPPLRLSGAGFHPFGFVLRFLMRRYFVVFFSMPVNGFGDVERRQQGEDVGLNADDQELEKDEHRCQQRRQDPKWQRNLQRNKVRAEQEEEEEHAGEVGSELQSVLGTDDIDRDSVSHKQVGRLGEVLYPFGNKGAAPRTEQEEAHAQEGCHEHQHDDAVYLERCPLEDDRIPEEQLVYIDLHPLSSSSARS